MLKYEELKAKELVREAIALEPSKTLYDARNILLRYNISRVVIAKDNKPFRNNYREGYCTVLVY